MAADDEGVAYSSLNIGISPDTATAGTASSDLNIGIQAEVDPSPSSTAPSNLNIGVGAPNYYKVLQPNGWGAALTEIYEDRVELGGVDLGSNSLNIT